MPHSRLVTPSTAAALSALVLATLACGGGPSPDLLADYRAARDDALAPVGPAPKGWTPDAVLQLSPDLVERLVQAGVEQLEPAGWTIDAPGVTLTPKLALDTVELDASDRCPTCFAADLVVTGRIKYDAGILGKGRIPTTVTAALDLKLDVGSKSKGFPVTASVDGVRKVRVELEGLPKALSDAIEPRLTDVVHEQVTKGVDPFEIARPGGDALPLRALRIQPQGRGVLLEMLTEAGTTASVVPGRQLGDWTLDIAEPALVRIIAREAFAAGPQDLGLIGELRGLSVADGGSLDLDVRIWRTEGNGWWRDLTVDVATTVRPKKLELKATRAEVVRSSPGAAFADPIAWLAESLVLSELEEAAAFAVPTVEDAKLGKAKATVRLEGLAPGRDSLRTYGSVSIE
jgi:hypothetical protein